LIGQGRAFELAQRVASFVLRKKRLPVLGTGLRGHLRRWRGRAPGEPTLPVWLRPQFVNKLGLRDRLVELNRGYRHEHPFHPAGYALASQGYWAGVLESEDAAWLGVPLERRAPFLDRRVLEFLLRVPPVPWCMEKELLREAMRTRLPEEIRTRRKTPLLRSPFEAQAERLQWSPLPLPAPHAALREFVDWSILDATLRGIPGSQSWEHLQPVSLNYWVTRVENDRAFLYSQNRES
jgi:asparagine synthase (glutamine-hydrolysing)